MSDLVSIRQAVATRVEEMIGTRGDWPCRKGCDDCCRRLASIPIVSQTEWESIREAINQLPSEAATAARLRIQESATGSRPFTCPLLDRHSGSCMVYAARPVECRTYGFYLEQDRVLGCARIDSMAAEPSDVVWGNHESVHAKLRALGPAAPLHEWLRIDPFQPTSSGEP